MAKPDTRFLLKPDKKELDVYFFLIEGQVKLK
jgi:hypothetical protein